MRSLRLTIAIGAALRARGRLFSDRFGRSSTSLKRHTAKNPFKIACWDVGIPFAWRSGVDGSAVSGVIAFQSNPTSRNIAIWRMPHAPTF